MERARLCDRPGCGAPAVSSLTFDYSARAAWLDDLTEPHPSRFELCSRHAERLGVPLGWSFDDRRGQHSLPIGQLEPAPALAFGTR